MNITFAIIVWKIKQHSFYFHLDIDTFIGLAQSTAISTLLTSQNTEYHLKRLLKFKLIFSSMVCCKQLKYLFTGRNRRERIGWEEEEAYLQKVCLQRSWSWPAIGYVQVSNKFDKIYRSFELIEFKYEVIARKSIQIFDFELQWAVDGTLPLQS